MNLVEDILQSVTELPPFPVVIQRALELAEDPRSSAKDVVEVIQYDQAITANVLKVCNSAFLGLRRTVRSLRDALVLIGFNQLLEIILSQESARLFQGPCHGYELQQGQLWQHSVASALLSRFISQRLGREENPAYFTAALLHDVGKTLLSRFVKDYFGEIKERVRDRNLSFVEAEKEVLGMDHAELGGRITEQWGFPRNIVSAVRYHHLPLEPDEDGEPIRMVYLCDLVAVMTGIGGGADGLAYRAHDGVMKHYQLTEKDIERWMLQLNDRFKWVKEILKVQ
jgi:putative nucleotidyltransferase with HDIG domain